MAVPLLLEQCCLFAESPVVKPKNNKYIVSQGSSDNHTTGPLKNLRLLYKRSLEILFIYDNIQLNKMIFTVNYLGNHISSHIMTSGFHAYFSKRSIFKN